MANPYQQPGGGYGAPQYYVQAGGMYPGAYYATPQGYMAAPAAGQPYGASIYGMPSAVPQYQVAQQPTVVAVPQVRAMANPLDAMFGAKPSAAPTMTPTAPKPAAPSVTDYRSHVAPSYTPSSSTQTEFGSFASAPPASRPAIAQSSMSYAPAVSAPMLTPSPYMSQMPSMGSAAIRAPTASARTADDNFGGFVSAAPVAAPKQAPVSQQSPYGAAVSPMSLAPTPVATAAPAKPAAPVVAPYVAPTPATVASAPNVRPLNAPYTAAPAPAPVTPAPAPAPAVKPAPPVAYAVPTAQAPPPATAAAAAAADDPRHPKTSKKAVDWSRVNVANVFADIEQENAMAAQFTPVTAAAPPSLSTQAAGAASATAPQQQDEWGSFQAPVSSPVPTASVPQYGRPAPPVMSAPASAAAFASDDWGPMVAAAPPPSAPVAASMPGTGAFSSGAMAYTTAAFAGSSAPALSSVSPSPVASGLLPPSAAQTASALFSSFSGFPALANLGAGSTSASASASALRSTAPPSLPSAAASFAGAVYASPSPTASGHNDVDFGESVATPTPAPAARSVAPPATVSPSVPTPAHAATAPASVPAPSHAPVATPSASPAPPVSLASSFGASPVFSSFAFKQSTPSAAADDFGDFAGASPVPSAAIVAKPPASSQPLSMPSNTPFVPLSMSPAPHSVFGATTPPMSSAIDFGDFTAPAPARPSAPLPTNPTKSAVDFGDFTSAPAPASTSAQAPLSVSPAMPSALALAPAPTVAVANAALAVASSAQAALAASFDTALGSSPFAQLSPAPAASPAVSAVAEDEWGSFETAKPSAPSATAAAAAAAPSSAAPKAAEPPRPMLSAEALLGRAMRVLETRNEDDFGSFASAAPPTQPAAPKQGAGGGFGFLFAGPPLASALAQSPGSPMVATTRPHRPASDSLADVLAFLVQHERFDEALACKVLIDAKSAKPSEEQLSRWRAATAPAGHLTAEAMRKQLGDALGAAALEKYAAKFGDLSEAALMDLHAAAAQQKRAQALLKRLLATKGVDLTDARRAALQAIAAELTAAQDFASLVSLKSSLAGAEEEAVRRGVWTSAKGNVFFRGLTELHLVYRRITQAIDEEGSDLMLSGLQASVAVAWNTLFATLASEAKRIEQEGPLLSAKDVGSVCGLCGLTASTGATFHSSCHNLHRHARH